MHPGLPVDPDAVAQLCRRRTQIAADMTWTNGASIPIWAEVAFTDPIDPYNHTSPVFAQRVLARSTVP